MDSEVNIFGKKGVNIFGGIVILISIVNFQVDSGCAIFFDTFSGPCF